MNNFSSHPLITNSQQYVFQKKFISIHSEDRDILKYPISSSFEIESVQLHWIRSPTLYFT
jgi:hypothetical protein